jgi:CHRD domain
MRTSALFAGLLLLAGSAPAFAGDHGNGNDRDKNFEARLSGYHEVHFIAAPTPALRGAISTGASGRFKASIDDRASVIHYEISYSGLEAPVTQSHIHFGQRHTVGGIVVWLCQTAGTPAPATVAGVTPMCPESGTVTGTITPAQVLTVTGQGIDAGQFEELVAAIRAGATYANVHSQLFAPGEIRGQVRHDRGRND